MRKRFSFIGLLIIFVLIISACSNQDSGSQETLESKGKILEEEESNEVETEEDDVSEEKTYREFFN